MGKRGPQAGNPSQKRILVPRRLAIHNDRELVRAQHFNDRLDCFLLLMENDVFPTNSLDGKLMLKAIEAVESIQHAVIAGIEGFSVSTAPQTHSEAVPEGESFLPGTYEIGRRQSRRPEIFPHLPD